MKKIGMFAPVLALGAVLGTGLVAPALAGGPVIVAEEPVVQAPRPAPMAMAQSGEWTGFYGGAQLGYGEVQSDGGALDGNGMLGGLHAGYRMDFGTFVAGAELAYDLTNIELGTDVAGADLDNLGSVALLGGIDMGQFLVYGTIGKSRASSDFSGTVTGDGSATGNFAGLGLDYAVSDTMTVGGSLVKHAFDDIDSLGTDVDMTALKARVSFKF